MTIPGTEITSWEGSGKFTKRKKAQGTVDSIACDGRKRSFTASA